MSLNDTRPICCTSKSIWVTKVFPAFFSSSSAFVSAIDPDLSMTSMPSTKRGYVIHGIGVMVGVTVGVVVGTAVGVFVAAVVGVFVGIAVGVVVGGTGVFVGGTGVFVGVAVGVVVGATGMVIGMVVGDMGTGVFVG